MVDKVDGFIGVDTRDDTDMRDVVGTFRFGVSFNGIGEKDQIAYFWVFVIEPVSVG